MSQLSLCVTDHPTVNFSKRTRLSAGTKTNCSSSFPLLPPFMPRTYRSHACLQRLPIDNKIMAPTKPAIPVPSNVSALREARVHSAVSRPEIVAVMIIKI